MKATKIAGLLAVVASLVITPSLFAAMTVTLQQDTSRYSFGVGGEFRAVGNGELNSIVNWSAYSTANSTTATASRNNSFQTFCIEYNEHFNPGATYNVGVSQNAMYGNQGPGGDPISIGTAWLYSQFAAGTLGGYNYTYGSGRASSTSAGALQMAIWSLEGEYTGTLTTAALTFINLATADLTARGLLGVGRTYVSLQADALGAFGVRALNLGAAGAVQDQLVIVVPEVSTLAAGALLILPLGISAWRILRRNRSA